MSKVIFIIVDGMGYETAKSKAGYLEHLAETGKAAKYRMRCELPSISRPLYETLLTGLEVSRHKIVANSVNRPSACENIFHLTKKHGLINAAAAYHWIWEMYGGGKPVNTCDLLNNRYHLHNDGDLMNGIFYSADDYPDTHLYADAEFLRKTVCPDFLLIHPMNVDHCGHIYGCQSKEYENAVIVNSDCIAYLLSDWMEDGYDLVVVADHGMDMLGQHAGNTELQREVPLYIVSDKVVKGDFTDQMISMLNIAPMLCRLLDIPASQEMSKNLEIRETGV